MQDQMIFMYQDQDIEQDQDKEIEIYLAHQGNMVHLLRTSIILAIVSKTHQNKVKSLSKPFELNLHTSHCVQFGDTQAKAVTTIK